jgi:hypothetical protein
MMTNIIMMYVTCREKLQLLREKIANDGQSQAKHDYEQAVAERLLKGI